MCVRAEAVRDPQAGRACGRRDAAAADRASFYVASLSSRTLIYKGMLTANQIEPMFPDLGDPDVESALALVHQRFSTNTFPSWPLAHPYRYIAHNGEINTLRGNINWMKAREALLESDVFGEDLKKILPIIREGGSDTAMFDNVLEFLVMAGRSLPHAVLMMIPEPWQNHEGMSPELRAFYEYHSSLMEPWDGPASIAFTDGTVIGAVLDRNGLRPSRYYVTKDDLVIMASEVGVLDIPAENIVVKERLHPGRIFLVDTAKGRIIADEEIKRELALAHPTASGCGSNLIADRRRAGGAVPAAARSRDRVCAGSSAFGYTQEDLRMRARRRWRRPAKKPIGSMGTDTPLAVLSERPRLLYDYFKQLFAQVTNPPLDAIREELVTSMASTIGPEAQPAEAASPSRAARSRSRIRSSTTISWRSCATSRCAGFRSVTLPMLYRPDGGRRRARRALDELCAQASAGGQGRAQHPDPVGPRRRRRLRADPEPAGDRRRAPPPGARRHAHAMRAGGRVGRRARSAPLSPAHRLRRRRGQSVPRVRNARRPDPAGRARRASPTSSAVSNYIKALNKGILKVMSKMGISTLQSYCGAQIFEAIGLDQAVRRSVLHVDRRRASAASASRSSPRKCGSGTSARFRRGPGRSRDLDTGGEYQWRRDGEYHIFNPETVFKLQHATRTGQYSVYRGVHEARRTIRAGSSCTLRGLLEFKPRHADSASTKSSRSKRSSSASPPARCRTARSARKRTRRSRSR